MKNMRQIRFRAMYDDMGGGWRYGMLIYEGQVPRIQNEGTMLFSTCLKGTEGQFTGLQDKNGIDIYEGDIVISDTLWGGNRIKGQVVFISRGMWMVEEINPEWSDQEYLCELVAPKYAERTEIIGNIYENPQLLSNEPNDKTSVATDDDSSTSAG